MDMDQDPSQVHLETGPPSDEEKLSALQTEDVAKVLFLLELVQSPVSNVPNSLSVLSGWSGLAWAVTSKQKTHLPCQPGIAAVGSTRGKLRYDEMRFLKLSFQITNMNLMSASSKVFFLFYQKQYSYLLTQLTEMVQLRQLRLRSLI